MSQMVKALGFFSLACGMGKVLTLAMLDEAY
jgi:hypothetical protein